MDNVISNKMTLSEEHKDLVAKVADLNVDGDVNESFNVCRSEEELLPNMGKVMISDIDFFTPMWWYVDFDRKDLELIVLDEYEK